MAYYHPRTYQREVAVVPERAAVLFIDIQNFNCHRQGAIYRNYTAEQLEGHEFQYFWSRLERITPNLQRLQSVCRQAGVETMYTVIQSLTRDGRDRSLDYKITGFHVPPGSWDAQVLDCIRPGNDEIILPKTSSSVFKSTNIDYVLRCMEKRYLILCGCVTDQCVEHAVRDACDLGYFITLVPDCCATYSQERHDNSISAIKGYCRIRTAYQLEEELLATISPHTNSLKRSHSQTLSAPMYLAPAVPPPHNGVVPARGHEESSPTGSMAAAAGQVHPGEMVSEGAMAAPHHHRPQYPHEVGVDLNAGEVSVVTNGPKRDRKIYFEFAKKSWELEDEFLLPSGETWVDVAVKGDPATGDRGLVFCKICREHARNNVFAKGYRAGKRSALREHMVTKDHKDIVNTFQTAPPAEPMTLEGKPSEPLSLPSRQPAVSQQSAASQ